MTKYGIFTKPIHVEKLVNYLNQHTKLDYVISTRKDELRAFDFDVGVSYCFPYIVDINYPVQDPRAWYNYHPAPLPKYPGLNNYSDAIADKVMEYGVTLHAMTMKVDGGEILAERGFRLASEPVSVNELGNITHYHLFQLFRETVDALGRKPKSKAEMERWLREP
ncbi:MAG: hypothetical protein M1530_03620 [Candidatus Marsarchaeota archaeon]|nr:hypothetical protein [Candidatus Marsarchaeota archaeon]